MTSPDGLSGFEAFELAFTGRRVELLLHALESDAPAPGPEAIVKALRRSPLPAIAHAQIVQTVSARSTIDTDVRIEIGEVAAPAYDGAPCVIVVSPDRLAAYAVPVDPPSDLDTDVSEAEPAARDVAPVTPPPAPLVPPVVTASVLRALLAAAGVADGLLDDVIDEFGSGAPLTNIICVARGRDLIPGVDARLEHHRELNAPTGSRSVDEHGSVDFHEMAVQRFVTAGTPLITKHPPVPGIPGHDVRGVVSKPPEVKDFTITTFAGGHTTVDGDVLVAEIIGRPVFDAQGMVEVVPVYEVAGDVDYRVGNIDFPGDVIVRGDVKSGFSIVSGGSVSVRGLVEGASITTAHDLAIGGAVGEHSSVFDVGGNLNARYLHNAEARVTGTATVVTEIVNSHITAECVVTNSNGRIVGGLTTARVSIDAGTLGSRDGRATEVTVTTDEPDAVIRARRVVQPGVVILIGSARRTVEDETGGSSFWNMDDRILGLAASADAANAASARAA